MQPSYLKLDMHALLVPPPLSPQTMLDVMCYKKAIYVGS